MEEFLKEIVVATPKDQYEKDLYLFYLDYQVEKKKEYDKLMVVYGKAMESAMLNQERLFHDQQLLFQDELLFILLDYYSASTVFAVACVKNFEGLLEKFGNCVDSEFALSILKIEQNNMEEMVGVAHIHNSYSSTLDRLHELLKRNIESWSWGEDGIQFPDDNLKKDYDSLMESAQEYDSILN